MGVRIRKDFWRERSIFITGHTGFKGAWLVFWLQQLGAKVTGYALNPEPHQSLFSTLIDSSSIEDIRGDIRDFSRLSSAISKTRPEIIIHLAAQSLVRSSYEQPLETLMTNVIGTANLLEASRSNDSLRSVLIITSDKCYKNQESLRPYKESDSMGGHDPYSASKGCAELVTSAFRNSFFKNDSAIGIATARAGNVIGGGDWSKDRIIPDAIRAFSRGRRLIVRNPKAMRPWQHVLDPLSGYLRLVERLHAQPELFSSGWNFGPLIADTIAVEKLCNLLVKTYGENVSWMSDEKADAPHEATLLSLDITKAQDLLDWTPCWNLSSALEHTINWYKCAQTGGDLLRLSKSQILEHQCML